MVNHIITQEVIKRIVKLVEIEKITYATIAERLGYSESAIADSYRRYLKKGYESFRKEDRLY